MMGLMVAASLVATAPNTSTDKTPAPDDGPWGAEQFRFDLGGIYTFYTSAVERGTDGDSNRQLVIDSSLGLYGAATYRVWGPISIGLFGQFESGDRQEGRFTGTFDEDDRAIVGDRFGGAFWELWFGPLVRAQYKGVFAEFGWGLVGLRNDDGRDDLPQEDGGTGTFRTDPSLAWLVGLGGAIEIAEPIELILRINYRIRYYTTRGGDDLVDGVAHGTQDIVPFVGLAWRIDR